MRFTEEIEGVPAHALAILTLNLFKRITFVIRATIQRRFHFNYLIRNLSWQCYRGINLYTESNLIFDSIESLFNLDYK